MFRNVSDKIKRPGYHPKDRMQHSEDGEMFIHRTESSVSATVRKYKSKLIFTINCSQVYEKITKVVR